MIGASANDISAAVQWYCWTFIGPHTQYLVCLPILQIQSNLAVFSMVLLDIYWTTYTISCLPPYTAYTEQFGSFLYNLYFSWFISITDCLFHTWFDNNFKNSNHLKTISQVLNYACKTKYPVHCSALTYFDEEEPSRLDYGKHKFGGPFTEEQVEDVKTILRFLSIFLSLFGIYIANNLLIQGNPFQLHLILTAAQN